MYITLNKTHTKSEVTVNLQTTKQGPNTWRGTHSKPDGTFNKNELDIIQHTMNILENLRGVGMFCLRLFHILKTQKKRREGKSTSKRLIGSICLHTQKEAGLLVLKLHMDSGCSTRKNFYCSPQKAKHNYLFESTSPTSLTGLTQDVQNSSLL